MQLFYEVFPVALFFITFKLYGIYTATIVGIVTTFLQVIITKVLTKKWDKKQLITFIVFVVFGGMTLYFHNPIFVKWKPTIIFWIFGIVIIGTQIFTQKPMAQRLMENVLESDKPIPQRTWKNLNTFWAFFFLLIGSINLFIAYQYTDEVWVNFKFYGITGALLLFSVAQTLYLMKYIQEVKK